MTRSGQDAGRPPPGNIAARSSRPAAQPGNAGLAGKATLGLVGLGVVGHVLRSRRFRERVIVGVIVLGALRGLGQENRASAFERLAAWNKRQVQLLERKAEHHARRLERKARRLERKAERQARRLQRKAKRQARRLTGRGKTKDSPA